MKVAAKYLDPQEHTHSKCRQPKERDVREARQQTERTLNLLAKAGVEVERPKVRRDCPNYRPCPFVSCRYNLHLDVTDAGSIKRNFDGLEPDEIKDSCALDLADRYDGMTLKEVGQRMSLTRERIRQIEQDALNKIKDHIGEAKLREWLEKGCDP